MPAWVITLIALIPALITAIAALLLNRWTIESARRKFTVELEDRRIRERAEDMNAHRSATESISTIADQMAKTSYGLVDRLQTEVVALQQQLTISRMAHNDEIGHLNAKIKTLSAEVRELRLKLGIVTNGGIN